MFVDDLPFQVDDTVIVEQRVYVQKEGLGVNGSAQHDGVGNARRTKCQLKLRKGMKLFLLRNQFL